MLLVVETITWKPHVETAMEIAFRRREQGEEVRYYNLRDGLPACEDQSPLHHALDLPGTRLRRAAQLLAGHGIAMQRPGYGAAELSAAERTASELIAACKDDADVKALRYRDYHDIGWGAISSVVSLARDSSASLDSHRPHLRRYLQAAILVYDRVCALLDELRPDQVLFFNGRFATTRAVLRAAQSRGTPWRIHERGGDRDRFWVTDCMPHEMDRIQDKIEQGWSPGKAEAGHAFFDARRRRIERDWHSFARSQQIGRLPPQLAAGGQDWVTYFTSSEDELLAIADCYRNERFPTQLDAMRALAEAAAAEGLRLCVRVHPHIGEKSRAEREKWARLDLPGAVLVGPQEPVDTYALIDHSRVVCTYGSTVGIEATYWGRPSLLFGPSYYDRLGVAQMAGDAEQIRGFLREPVVFPQERTLPYGAFWESLGEPYRYYRAETLHRGSICGVYLDDSAPIRAARKLLGPGARLLGWSR